MADNSTSDEVKRHWTYKKLPEMTDREFAKWQALLDKRTGMTITPERKSFLQTNLSSRMREVGCHDYEEYFNKVIDRPSGMMEWMTLVDRLTVQETRFYRDEDAFSLVADYLRNLPKKQLEKRPIEVWSVGCSTGEEPYTLAMVVDDCLETLGIKGYFAITGTDISTPALGKARAARYPMRKLITLGEEHKQKYFTQINQNEFEVIPEIRARVCFSRVNVLEIKKAPMDSMNIIFCQNLLIYFKRWRRKEILNRLAERLQPGGLLVLGLGEIVDWKNPLLERINNEKNLAFIRRQ